MRTRETEVTFNREEYWIIDEVDRMAKQEGLTTSEMMEKLIRIEMGSDKRGCMNVQTKKQSKPTKTITAQITERNQDVFHRIIDMANHDGRKTGVVLEALLRFAITQIEHASAELDKASKRENPDSLDRFLMEGALQSDEMGTCLYCLGCDSRGRTRPMEKKQGGVIIQFRRNI